jgi:parallel beta-helix repeat protein
VVIVLSGEDIAHAARNAAPGSIIAVAPGLYQPVVLSPGDLQGSLTLYADVTGELTGNPPAPVTIVARSGDAAAFEAFSQAGLTIDGFTLRGGTDAALVITESVGVVVLDCTVTRSDGDAILIERSDDVLIFNNVLAGNGGSGLALLGSRDVRAFNNTVYDNAAAVFASIDEQSRPSANVVLLNNIFHQNSRVGILIDTEPPTSLGGYEGDFNLNTDGCEGAPRGPSDIDADPLFILAGLDDFHLAPSSPAIDRGTDAIDGDLMGALHQRSTQANGSVDAPPLDLGYHYPGPMPAVPPTPVRRPTPPVPTPEPTRTPRGTVTPTAFDGTVTPTPRLVHINVGQSTGGPGDAVNVTVSLAGSGLSVAATVNDILFDATALILDPATCRLARAIRTPLLASVPQAGTVRVFIGASPNRDPIPDGPLYTCTFRIALSALPDSYVLTNRNALAFSPETTQLDPVVGASGSLTVSLFTRTCDGDCNADLDVTVDEVITGINIALGNLPVTTCLQFDRRNDGIVTVDELVAAVNRALQGCAKRNGGSSSAFRTNGRKVRDADYGSWASWSSAANLAAAQGEVTASWTSSGMTLCRASGFRLSWLRPRNAGDALASVRDNIRGGHSTAHVLSSAPDIAPQRRRRCCMAAEPV